MTINYIWKQERTHISLVAQRCEELNQLNWEIFQILDKSDSLNCEYVTILCRIPKGEPRVTRQLLTEPLVPKGTFVQRHYIPEDQPLVH